MQTITDDYPLEQPSAFWDICNDMKDKEHASLVKHYIASFCSQPLNENMRYVCRNLIINYMICNMSNLFDEKFNYKMDRWINHFNDSLTHHLEKY